MTRKKVCVTCKNKGCVNYCRFQTPPGTGAKNRTTAGMMYGLGLLRKLPTAVEGASRTAAPLLQIRHGYWAQWNRLAFAVETDSDQWTLHVRDAVGSETLYTAHRSGARAAQVAAAEFAIFPGVGLQ